MESWLSAPLLIIGPRGWVCDDIVDIFETSSCLGDRLFWLDTVGDEELGTFYRAAHTVLFALYVERFGSPLLEAASHGLPILVAKEARTVLACSTSLKLPVSRGEGRSSAKAGFEACRIVRFASELGG
jgi:hypothetical protein